MDMPLRDVILMQRRQPGTEHWERCCHPSSAPTVPTRAKPLNIAQHKQPVASLTWPLRQGSTQLEHVHTLALCNCQLCHTVLCWQGHAAAISCMSWSSDDARLASVGAGGACYQWDVPGGVKIAQEEYVDKQNNYCWVEFCSNNSTSGVVVRSLDGKLQHIQVTVLPCADPLVLILSTFWTACAWEPDTML